MNIQTISPSYSFVPENLNASIHSDHRAPEKMLRVKQNLSYMVLNAWYDFLNPVACRSVNPFSTTFWDDLQIYLKNFSESAQVYPRSKFYRANLKPYLFQPVSLTAASWSITDDFNTSSLRVCLRNVHLSRVWCNSEAASPSVYVDHLHVLVSNSWLARVMPDPNDSLIANGMLYEYVNHTKERNIGICPVVLLPRSRTFGSVQRETRLVPSAQPELQSA